MPNSWRMAKSLEVLLAEINAQAPNRDKQSDGGIGNAEHASRNSDHNPWITINELVGGHPHSIRIVTARDFDHDPEHGMDGERLHDQLVASRDSRIKYVIWNHHMTAGNDGPQPWVERPYHGANAHTHHVHLSVEDTGHRLPSGVYLFDSLYPWIIDLGVTKSHCQAPARVNRPILKMGDKGPDVVDLQNKLKLLGHGTEPDGWFGDKTDREVRLFQSVNGMVPDGVVGKYTWMKLET